MSREDPVEVVVFVASFFNCMSIVFVVVGMYGVRSVLLTRVADVAMVVISEFVIAALVEVSYSLAYPVPAEVLIFDSK